MTHSVTLKIYKVTNRATSEVQFYINPTSMVIDLIKLNPIMLIEVTEVFYPNLNLLEYKKVNSYAQP